MGRPNTVCSSSKTNIAWTNNAFSFTTRQTKSWCLTKMIPAKRFFRVIEPWPSQLLNNQPLHSKKSNPFSHRSIRCCIDLKSAEKPQLRFLIRTWIWNFQSKRKRCWKPNKACRNNKRKKMSNLQIIWMKKHLAVFFRKT